MGKITGVPVRTAEKKTGSLVLEEQEEGSEETGDVRPAFMPCAVREPRPIDQRLNLFQDAESNRRSQGKSITPVQIEEASTDSLCAVKSLMTDDSRIFLEGIMHHLANTTRFKVHQVSRPENASGALL